MSSMQQTLPYIYIIGGNFNRMPDPEYDHDIPLNATNFSYGHSLSVDQISSQSVS